jgi:hypothetical protein
MSPLYSLAIKTRLKIFLLNNFILLRDKYWCIKLKILFFSLISIFSLPIFYYFLDDLKIIIGVSAALIAIQFYWPLKIKLALLESSKQLTKSYLIKIVHVIISYPVMFLFLFLGYYYLVAPVFWIVFVAVVYFSTINLDIFHIKDINQILKKQIKSYN